MVTLLRLAACSVPLLIGLTSRCFAHWARASCAPRHCHPLNQFPLKSYGFSGAETAKKRFLLWKMEFSGAKIAPSPPYTPPGTIVPRKGSGSTIHNGRLAAPNGLQRSLVHWTFASPVSRTACGEAPSLSHSPLGFFDSLCGWQACAAGRFSVRWAKDNLFSMQINFLNIEAGLCSCSSFERRHTTCLLGKIHRIFTKKRRKIA